MYLKQIYTGFLSEAAYFIESKNEAIVIDPLRDIDTYITLAEKQNATIKYIFKTHSYDDFVSGHLNLSKKTGATIIYGPGTEAKFPFYQAKDGEIFSIGDVKIKVLHTPGHTMESSCYILIDEEGKPSSIFTGDTLFVGDVRRPDLNSGNMKQTELASIIYDTIQNKILPLPDDLVVYPAHGTGTSCGKNPGNETFSTIGELKMINYALNAKTKEEFIAAIKADMEDAPPYFSINAKINKEEYESLESIREKSLVSLSLKEFKSKIKADALILDTRKAAEFANNFISGSLFIGLEGRLAEWAGTLVPFHQKIILVTLPGKEEETICRLARVGFDKVEGYLEGGFDTWLKAGEKIDIIIDIEAEELAMDLKFDENLVVVDVRKESEFAEGHISGALNMPVHEMTDLAQIATLEENQNIYIHCASGYRSIIAASIFKKQGYHNIRNVAGGWSKIKEQKTISTEKEASVLN